MWLNLETLVLQNPLDGSILVVWGQLGLEDNTKRTVAYDLALLILYLFRFPGKTVLHLLAYDLCLS